jgi:hypothetical protein
VAIAGSQASTRDRRFAHGAVNARHRVDRSTFNCRVTQQLRGLAMALAKFQRLVRLPYLTVDVGQLACRCNCCRRVAALFRGLERSHATLQCSIRLANRKQNARRIGVGLGLRCPVVDGVAQLDGTNCRGHGLIGLVPDQQDTSQKRGAASEQEPVAQ